MQKQTIQFVRGLVILPFLATGSPFAMLHYSNLPVLNTGKGGYAEVAKDRAAKIDAYFAERDMPLEGYGAKMVAAAEKNGLDWRLIPAIAIKESTGGRFACGHNPFGWGSCKVNNFKNWDQAIETIALNLGGNNPATVRYYKGKTTEEILYAYNGSVIPEYVGEVKEFMDLVEKQEVN